MSLMLVIILIGSLLAGCNETQKQQINQATAHVVAKGNEAKQFAQNFMNNETVRNNTKIDIAGRIATTINNANFHEIDLKKVQSYDDYKQMADNINLMIQIVNDKADTSLKYLGKTTEDYDKFMMEVQRYTPLVDNFNDLIFASRGFNRNEEASVDQVIIKTTSFAIEATIVVAGAFYELSFMAVGAIARSTGLTTLANTCGPCVSTVMSAGHWTIRNGLANKASNVTEESLEGNI